MTNEQRAILAAWDKAVSEWRKAPGMSAYSHDGYKNTTMEWFRVTMPVYLGTVIYGPGLTAWGY